MTAHFKNLKHCALWVKTLKYSHTVAADLRNILV